MVPKFRAYIKGLDEFDYNDVPHKGHFVYGNLIKGKPNDDVDAIVGDLIEINDEYVNVEWWQSIEKGSAEQYTGLKDANGKEIYEGDIVRMHVVLLSPDDKVGYVEYHKKYGYSLIMNDRRCRQEYWANDNKAVYEVIGNVHENPELLEDK